MTTSPKLRFVLGFIAFFTALWLLWETPVVYPVKMFVVLLHELSHAFAGIVTGGRVEEIVLDPRLGGHALIVGGNSFIMLSAGYLGSLFWGVILYSLARAPWLRPGLGSACLGVLVVVLTLAFVRNGFGMVFGLTFGASLLGVARFAGATLNRGLMMALGLVSVLYAMLDIKSDVLDRPGAPSDAHMLAEMTGVPTTVWGTAWIAIGLLVTWRLLARAFRQA